MKEYAMTVKPPDTLRTGRLDGLTASERHVATLIDNATNVFRVASLRPELHYWQRRLTAGTAVASQIAAFMSKMLTELQRVPRRASDEEAMAITFAMPAGFNGTGLRPERRLMSKFAVEASRVLFYYYAMTPLSGSPGPDADRIHVAELVDAVLGLARVMDLEPVLCGKKDALIAGKLTENEVCALMRSAGVCFDKMPTYKDNEESLKLLA
jgi:hypothetical protein